MGVTTTPCDVFFDVFLSWALQAGLVPFTMFGFLRNWVAERKAGRGTAAVQMCGAESMQ
jgi:hypothetical protein